MSYTDEVRGEMSESRQVTRIPWPSTYSMTAMDGRREAAVRNRYLPVVVVVLRSDRDVTLAETLANNRLTVPRNRKSHA